MRKEINFPQKYQHIHTQILNRYRQSIQFKDFLFSKWFFLDKHEKKEKRSKNFNFHLSMCIESDFIWGPSIRLTFINDKRYYPETISQRPLRIIIIVYRLHLWWKSLKGNTFFSFTMIIWWMIFFLFSFIQVSQESGLEFWNFLFSIFFIYFNI